MYVDMVETWLPIDGVDGYEVNDQGRVRSLPHVVVLSGKRAGQVRHIGGKILRPSPQHDGHLTVVIGSKGDGTRQRRFVHRLVLETFVGPCPPGLECRHRNGDPSDNRLGNLRWGTRSQNIRDAVGHGTQVQIRKTHCTRHGHLLKAPNLTPRSIREGHRGCLACARATSLVHNSRARRGVELDHREWADRYYAKIMEAAA